MSNTEQLEIAAKPRKNIFAPITGSLIFRNRTLLGVSLAVFAGFTGAGMVGPVRVLYAQKQGASLAIIGAMASAYLISNFLFQYPVGWLADRYGRKQLIILGLLVQGLIAAVYLPITDPTLFVVLRFVEGMAGAAIMPPARAIIADNISSDQQGEAYGSFGAFFYAGFLLGPGIGGLVASWGYATAFIGAIVFRLVGVVIVIVMVKNVVPSRATSAETLAGPTASPAQPTRGLALYRALFLLPLIGAYILAFGDYLYLGFDMTLMPLWLHDHLAATIGMIGLTYVVWSFPTMVLAPISGRIADRKRRSTLILIFGLVQVPLYLFYGLSNIFWPLLIAFTIHGVVYAFIQPAVDASVAASSTSGARARVQGLYTTFGLAGAFIGASSFGTLYTVNFRYPLFALGLGYGLCVLIGGLLIRHAEKRAKV